MNAGDRLWMSLDMTTVDMQLPVMEMVMTFQLVDRPPSVPSMVDMLVIAMGRPLPAMDMDMLQLPMADMLLSATDMTLLNMDMDRPLPECSMVDTLLLTRGYSSFNLNSSTMSRT